jgi:flagellar M-ring protein FliF
VSLFKNLLIGSGFLALVLFVIRPLMSSLKISRPPVLEIFEPAMEATEKLSAAERAQISMQMAEQQNLIEQAKNDPYQVAQILQNWLGEDTKS